MSAVVVSPRLQMRDMLIHDISQVVEIERTIYEFPWRQQIFQDCFHANHICKVYELGLELLGYGIASVGASECHILNVCIHPEVQRHGLGTGLLHSVIQECQRRAVGMIFLEVRASNFEAQALYTKIGFNQVGIRSGYYPATKGREDALVLAKDLS